MKFHDELCDKIFNGEDLKPEVSEKLLEIADAFIEFLEVPTDAIKDVVITGSMVSYNYTQYSDIDLHLKVDFDKIHKDCPIVQGYLWQSKAMFNKNHDIKIYGIPVEVYAESIEEDTIHNGLYSLWQGKWIDFPEKIEPTDNDSAVEAKFNEFKDMADNINDSEEAEALIDKLYIMRKAGLEEVGEFSTENLAFKKVRDAGILERLKEMKKEKIDKQLSLESYNEKVSVSDYIKSLKDNGTLTDMEGAEYFVQAFNDGKLEVIAGYKDIEKAAKRFLDICGKYDKAVFKQLFDNGKDIKVLDSDHKELNEMPKYLSYVNESIKAEAMEINEGMWASPFTMENAKQIAELLAKPITYEELDSEEGKHKYWNIIGDDEFWDNVADEAFDIPEADARYLIVKFLEDWIETKENFNPDAYSQKAEDIIKKAIFMFNGITENMGKSIKEDRLFKKQLTPLPSKDAKLNKGDKVTIDGQNGEIIEVRPMKMSDTCTYKIKLDNGKVIWRYEEEIINEEVKTSPLQRAISRAFAESEAIYKPSLIYAAYKLEQQWLKSLGLGQDEQAPEIMLFVINNPEEGIEDTKLVKREDVYTYTPEQNEYYLDMTRDSGDVITDYNLEPAAKLVDSWNLKEDAQTLTDKVDKAEQELQDIIKMVKVGYQEDSKLINNLNKLINEALEK